MHFQRIGQPLCDQKSRPSSMHVRVGAHGSKKAKLGDWRKLVVLDWVLRLMQWLVGTEKLFCGLDTLPPLPVHNVDSLRKINARFVFDLRGLSPC